MCIHVIEQAGEITLHSTNSCSETLQNMQTPIIVHDCTYHVLYVVYMYM